MAGDHAIGSLITFLSDYGHRDEFVGICHGVIARRCPSARVLDLTHGIPRHDVRTGALVLRAALAYLPAAVHLAVVDPDVGAVGTHARRAVALRTLAPGRVLVGPDNGLLMLAADQLGGVLEAVDIGDSRECLRPISRTFHGRDIFAPVAGALAAGEELAGVGEPLGAAALRRIELPAACLRGGVLAVHVLHRDHFGNLILDASAEQVAAIGAQLGDELSVRHAGVCHLARYASTFSDVPPGGLLIYQDAQRMAALAVNQGSAAQELGAGRDDELLVGLP